MTDIRVLLGGLFLFSLIALGAYFIIQPVVVDINIPSNDVNSMGFGKEFLTQTRLFIYGMIINQLKLKSQKENLSCTE